MISLIKKLQFEAVRRYRHSTIPRWVILTLDIFLFFVAFLMMELFRLNSLDIGVMRESLVKLILSFLLTMTSYLISGAYRNIIRHLSLGDVYRILAMNIGATLVCIGIRQLNDLFHPPLLPPHFLLTVRESILLYMLLAMLMIMARIGMMWVYNNFFRRRRSGINVLIYGAGAAGLLTYNALQQDRTHNYRVMAFIDDDMSKVNQKLQNVPIMRARTVLTQKYVDGNNVKQLIIAIPSIRVMHKQAITNRALDLGLTVKAVPHVNLWIDGGFTSNQIQDVKIEDLLGREPIRLDNVNIVREVVDKTILVTGAAGSIGSEICRQLMQYKPAKLVMLDQAESPMYDLQFELRNTFSNDLQRMEFVIANVKDRRRMEEVFEQFRPQLIYHAAAYKHVPFMEENPYEAVYINVFGTRNLADLAVEYGAQKFVMVSTDKAVNPTNVMGATKRMAEIYIQSRSTATTHFVTTRFGNVLGSNGSVIPLFKKQIAAGGPLTVTHRDIIRYFMTIPEACNLVLEAGAMGEGGDIFVFDMGKPVKIYDMARKMIQLSGRPEIEIKEIGLRPGEKLYEELLATKENTIPTYHPKIMRAQVRHYPLEAIDKEYAELWEVLATMDEMKIVTKMKSIVPEFVSNNSVFCQLDQSATSSN